MFNSVIHRTAHYASLAIACVFMTSSMFGMFHEEFRALMSSRDIRTPHQSRRNNRHPHEHHAPLAQLLISSDKKEQRPTRIERVQQTLDTCCTIQ